MFLFCVVRFCVYRDDNYKLNTLKSLRMNIHFTRFLSDYLFVQLELVDFLSKRSLFCLKENFELRL